ncbi:MAG: hypothetical protein WD431_19295, partial [Cyclobacteriaceae bacterium]
PNDTARSTGTSYIIDHLKVIEYKIPLYKGGKRGFTYVNINISSKFYKFEIPEKIPQPPW